MDLFLASIRNRKWLRNIKNEETPAQVLSCKFSEIFKKTHFVGHIRKDA